MFIEVAKTCLKIESNAIKALIPRIGIDFFNAVNLILNCSGRIIVSGMGKSGLIGKKIASTLASTGTPAFFLHPAEAIHGDLGMVVTKDIVLALSNSGETAELLNILPILKRIGSKIIAMTGKLETTLSANADILLNIGVSQEACPLGLVPTASTTAALAMGDALAVALISARNFKPEDFAVFHPGGTLGKKLLTVGDIMHQGKANPLITKDSTVKNALFIMTKCGFGATSVVDNNGKLIGIVTDGDIRRKLEKGYNFLDISVDKLMSKKPTTITRDKLVAFALNIMEKNKPRPITVLPVIDQDYKAVGIIHITDFLRQGVI